MKIVIIGGGPAGRSAAMGAAQLEANVTLIEKKHIGGTCLHEGCMVICGFNDVVKFYQDSEKFQKMGIIPQKHLIDYSQVADGIKKVTRKIENVLKHETRESGVEIVTGEVSRVSQENVVANGKEHSYDRLIIATGARPFIPPINGAEHALTYKDVLDLKNVPENLNIVGSGVIASEFAGIFASLGSNVNILCRGQFLKNLDDEIKEYVVKNLLNGVNVHENVKVNEITRENIITSNGEIKGLSFLATGMTPNTEIIKGMVKMGSKGHIEVNKQMQTSNPSIYAAGDVVNTVNNTPVARMEGLVAARNACGISSTMDYHLIPQSLTLYYPVSFLKTESKKASNEFDVRIRGSAGPGSFWNVLDGNTGLTKLSTNIENGEITGAYSISPSSRTSMPYLAKMIKDGYKTFDFDDFIESHPSTDALYKLLHFLAKYG
ncbi:MAG: NAD(P)/FAD-dependent oxidoreductase [Methanobacterium sp.]|jgi:dihydrolipoamide dehydrogenase|nr:NAD(P)/FAD-dependent oxidoreductase [Methanobacterium sp.]